MMKLLILATLTLLIFPTMARAQALVQVDVQVYAAGGTVPVWTNTYPIATITCNAAAPVGADVRNPTRFYFDDPANAGKVCIGVFGPGLLATLPAAAGYTATVSVTDDLGQVSAPSMASPPFPRVAPPGARTGAKVIR